MTDHSRKAPGPSAPGTPFDAEIDVKRIVEIGAWLAAIMVVAGLAGFFIYKGLGGWAQKEDPKPSPLPEALIPVEPPAPRLQVSPETDLQTLRRENQERLASWGWVDKGAGIAHMPIDEAIARLAVPEPAPAAAPASAVPAPAVEAAPPTAPADAHAPTGAPGSGH
jgi:hypothetical protein